ncbi:MAG: hypothetical protein HKN16_01250 [Saprospiraceae bacterium]|nr:hypothetical protein [Saprospiraceae bacterium]
MLYQIVKPLARWILGLNFRRIYLSNSENIPRKGPVILAVNHPTAFIEPCVLASFQNRPLNFLVRGDFFRKKIFSYLLGVLHMIPIYRMKDGGYSKIKKNFSSFERCFDALEDGKAIMILAEGFCIHEKRLRPIRKGTSRLAFGTLAKYPIEDLRIIPVGVNFTDSDSYRSDLMIDFGDAIHLNDYKDLLSRDEPEAVRTLTEDIQKALRNQVIHIEDPEDDELVEEALSIYRLDKCPVTEDKLSRDNYRLQDEMHIANRINTFSAGQKKELAGLVQSFKESHREKGLGPWVTAKGVPKRITIWLLLFLGFPFALVGGILLAIPLIPMQILGNLPGISIEFRHSIKVSIGAYIAGIGQVFLLVLAIHYSSLLLASFIILAPLLVRVAIRYLDLIQVLRKTKGFNRVRENGLADLQKQKELIIEKLFRKNLG